MNFKRLIAVLILAVFVLAVPGMAQAVMYYSFEGTVSAYHRSATIDFQDQDFSAVFAVDFDDTGSSVDSTGTHVYSNSTTTNYFFAQLIFTNFTQMPGTIGQNDTYGYDVTSTIAFPGGQPMNFQTGFIMGTSFNGQNHGISDSSFSVSIGGGTSLVSNWAVGQSLMVDLSSIVAGATPIWDDRLTTELATGNVTLTSISDTMPAATPIPGAVWLLATGVIGLLGLRKKFA